MFFFFFSWLFVQFKSCAAKFTQYCKNHLMVIEFSDLITALACSVIFGRNGFVFPGGLKHLFYSLAYLSGVMHCEPVLIVITSLKTVWCLVMIASNVIFHCCCQ